jgi:hypothetical protein
MPSSLLGSAQFKYDRRIYPAERKKATTIVANRILIFWMLERPRTTPPSLFCRTAIVVFRLFYRILQGSTFNFANTIVYFLKVAFGG